MPIDTPLILTPLILASGSKIRQQILQNAAIPFHVLKGNSPEINPTPKETATDYVLRCSHAKALDCYHTHQSQTNDQFIVGCDQVVRFENQILRKVSNQNEAVTRLKLFQSQPHYLVNGLTIIRNSEVLLQQSTEVKLTLQPLPESQLKQYIELENPLSSVACYYLEGAGIKLIKSLEGDYFSALGLPVSVIADFLLKQTGQLF